MMALTKFRSNRSNLTLITEYTPSSTYGSGSKLFRSLFLIRNDKRTYTKHKEMV